MLLLRQVRDGGRNEPPGKVCFHYLGRAERAAAEEGQSQHRQSVRQENLGGKCTCQGVAL